MSLDPDCIYQFGEEPFACPECGVRVDFGDPVGEDDDGPIYEGTCPTHGTFKMQSVDDEDETCRTHDCDGDPNDGEGWDGYCGNCADRREEADTDDE